MLNVLGVEVRKAGKIVLVEVHHEQLVRGGQVDSLARELPVKVRHIFAMPHKLVDRNLNVSFSNRVFVVYEGEPTEFVALEMV